MKNHTVTCASLLTVLSATGCSGAGPSGDVPAMGPEGTSAGPASNAQEATVSIRGFTHAYGTPLPGVRVCQGAGPAADGSCVTSGSDGSFTLSGVPANAAVSMFFQKSGFLGVLRAIETQTTDIALPESENELPPTGVPQMLLGTQTDAKKGHIEFFVKGAGSQAAPEVSVTLRGGDGSSAAPIYLEASGAPATAASAGWQGGFANLTEGLYVLRFGGPSVKCAPDGLYGFPMTAYQDPTSGEADVIVPVVAGNVTTPVGATCTAQ